MDQLLKEVGPVVVPSVLGWELDSKQYVLANYLVPSIFGFLLYVVNFACDLTTAYRHNRDDNPIWASLTLFVMYLPVIGCFIATVSAWELWPEQDRCGFSSVKWFVLKFSQHALFPIWSVWRYAEKIFWSIEGYRAESDDERMEIMELLNKPRTIELYFFFQGYLQAAPQILLQLHILMRFVQDSDGATVDAQAYSIVSSIAKMALVTTMYQRFKSQKIGGKYYPWFKPNKYYYSVVDSSSRMQRRSTIIYQPKPSKSARNDSGSQTVLLRRARPSSEPDRTVSLTQGKAFWSLPSKTPADRSSSLDPNTSVSQPHTPSSSQPDRPLSQLDSVPPAQNLERRRSSDFYEKPTYSFLEELSEDHQKELDRETSVVGGPPRLLLRADETDFKPKRLLEIKGLPEDDIAGKFISFLWWSCFLLSRMLAVSSFAYFYKSEAIWVLSAHFILVMALLLYDATTDDVKRAKGFFFVFIGWVYLFCLIEFKIKFKKVAFIYNGFFLLMFLENFTMVLVWWFRNIDEDITNDWWYRYIFYVIIGCSILSMLSMLLYVKVLKPHKVVVEIVAQK